MLITITILPALRLLDKLSKAILLPSSALKKKTKKLFIAKTNTNILLNTKPGVPVNNILYRVL